MGEQVKEQKKNGFFSNLIGSIFWIIITLVVAVIAIIWILYTVQYFDWYHDGWDTLNQWDFFKPINETFKLAIDKASDNGEMAEIGVPVILVSGSILLAYGTLMLALSKLPVVRRFKFFKTIVRFTLSFFVGLSVLAIVVGIILLFV